MTNDTKVTYPILKLYCADIDGNKRKMSERGGGGEKILSFIKEDNGLHFLKVDETCHHCCKDEELLSASINSRIPPVIHKHDEKVVIAHLEDHHVDVWPLWRNYHIHFKSERQAQGFVQLYKMFHDMDKDLVQANRSDDESMGASSFYEGLNTQDWPDNYNPNLEERKAAVSSGSSGTSNSSSPESVEFVGVGGKTANSSSNSEQEDDYPRNQMEWYTWSEFKKVKNYLPEDEENICNIYRKLYNEINAKWPDL